MSKASPILRQLSLIIAVAFICLNLAACVQSATRASSTTRAAPAAAVALDSDGNGFPDALEIHAASERENFRRWFTAIAEMQFYQPSAEWNASQRDCAGLVRFAMRESLRPHDRAWFQKMGVAYKSVAPDVRGLKLASNPLGEKIFRTAFGSYHEDDLPNGVFSEFADARTLKTYNASFVSRDERQARAGDLLFFYQPWVQKYPYHVMIFLGRPGENSEGASDWLVYHTGSSPDDKEGTVKRVRLTVLAKHPDKRWRPVESNSNFLGFYRLKILA